MSGFHGINAFTGWSRKPHTTKPLGNVAKHFVFREKNAECIKRIGERVARVGFWRQSLI